MKIKPSKPQEQPARSHEKPVVWVSAARRDLKEFPDTVKSDIGQTLYLVQIGEKPGNAKPLHGFGGAGVLEIVENFQTDAYRAVYTVRFEDAIYVLHCFQKKSKRGGETPKPDMDLIRQRLREAQELSEARQARKEKSK